MKRMQEQSMEHDYTSQPKEKTKLRRVVMGRLVGVSGVPQQSARVRGLRKARRVGRGGARRHLQPGRDLCQ